MKGVSRFLGMVLLMVNLLFAVMMLVSGYSAFLHPASHPYVAVTGLAFPFFLIFTVLFLLFWLMVYRKYALLSLLALLACYKPINIYFPMNAAKEKPESAIKVLTYNTLSFGQHADHTSVKPNPVISYLRKSDADVICLQEANGGRKLSAKRVQTLLKYPYYHYRQVNNTGLACYSRFPVLSVKQIPYDSDNNGSMLYLLKIDADTVAVFNNHLESNKLTMDDREMYSAMLKSPNKDNLKGNSRKLGGKIVDASKIRARQADKVVEEINRQRQKGRSIIVCGDFNDSPLAYPHRIMSEDLQDAFVVGGKGLGISYNRNYFYFRIDHILASKDWKVAECVVDRSIRASDHYPVWCYLSH